MPPASACAMRASEPEPILWVRQQMSGGKGGKGANLESLGNRALSEDGAKWRKPGGNRRKPSAVLLSHPSGARPVKFRSNMPIACGNCGNWFPPAPPMRSLRLDARDLHILRPLGALLAVLR